MSRALQINSSPQGWMARNTKPVPLAEKGWVITMKKISIILLSAVLVFSMAACNGGKEKADNQTEKQTESVKPTKEAEMATEAVTEVTTEAGSEETDKDIAEAKDSEEKTDKADNRSADNKTASKQEEKSEQNDEPEQKAPASGNKEAGGNQSNAGNGGQTTDSPKDNVSKHYKEEYTMCEMYVMQLYLQKAALEEMGIYHFDSWAANFGEVTTALELTVEGSGFRFKSRFNKFTNLPELMNIFREVADVQTADMLDLDVPALRGGKPIIVESEPDWYVKQVMEDFVVRAERIRGGGVDPSVDNFLKITHEARLLGTDARLIDKDAPNNPDGKLNKVAENVWKEYEKGNANGHIGCQLIFSDIGTPGPDKDFTIYDYLKETLIQYGIPADEIAFIHDAKTDAQRDALFKEMRTGKKKVLIGSTDKCGTGVNVQTHLVAMHHVDCPWKPSSIEQREGRGIRQGNENEEVAIYRYVTKGTFDAYNWSLVENKQRFISQVMTSKAVSRSCEDIDEATLSYAEIKAVATGNPLIKEKMEIDNDVQRLKLLKASYDNQRYGLQDNFMIKYPKLIKTAKNKKKARNSI